MQRPPSMRPRSNCPGSRDYDDWQEITCEQCNPYPIQCAIDELQQYYMSRGMNEELNRLEDYPQEFQREIMDIIMQKEYQKEMRRLELYLQRQQQLRRTDSDASVEWYGFGRPKKIKRKGRKY